MTWHLRPTLYCSHPVAKSLADAGLHRVTISLDSMDEDIFRHMSGNRGELSKVLEGIEAAENAGLTPIKINVVVQRGVNDQYGYGCA